jgi:hypothetical protein
LVVGVELYTILESITKYIPGVPSNDILEEDTLHQFLRFILEFLIDTAYIQRLYTSILQSSNKVTQMKFIVPAVVPVAKVHHLK